MNSRSKFKCGGIFPVARITHNTILRVRKVKGQAYYNSQAEG